MRDPRQNSNCTRFVFSKSRFECRQFQFSERCRASLRCVFCGRSTANAPRHVTRAATRHTPRPGGSARAIGTALSTGHPVQERLLLFSHVILFLYQQVWKPPQEETDEFMDEEAHKVRDSLLNIVPIISKVHPDSFSMAVADAIIILATSVYASMSFLHNGHISLSLIQRISAKIYQPGS